MRAFHEKNVYPDGFPVDIFRFSHFSFLAHWHNDVEIVYIYEGSMKMTVNSETRILTEGEFGICCSGDIHSYDSDDLHCNGILAFFSAEIIGAQVIWPEGAAFVTPFVDEDILRKYELNSDFTKRIGSLLSDVYNEMTEKGEYYQTIVRSRLLELHALIMRNVPKRLDKTGHTKSYSMLNKIQNALDYINSNYMEDIALSEAAAQAELRTSQFSKLFRHMCGMSFVTYLNSVRVSRAEERIKGGVEPITDIALECGFNSIRNFNRTFREIKGTTPSSLRKSRETM